MEKIEAQKREIEKEAHEAAREAREAETAKREAEELLKREALEIMERIECEKHDIEREAAERQRKEEREAAQWHDQLLCVIEKAKLALEQERINSQQFQQQRKFEFKCQLQEKQHKDGIEKSEAQRAFTQPRETIKAKSSRILVFNEGKDEMDSYLLRV